MKKLAALILALTGLTLLAPPPIPKEVMDKINLAATLASGGGMPASQDIEIIGTNGNCFTVIIGTTVTNICVDPPPVWRKAQPQFMLTGNPTGAVSIEFTADLAQWSPWLSVTNWSAITIYDARPMAMGFYRTAP